MGVISEKFGQVLSEIMKKQGVTQSELADNVGTIRQVVARWANGENIPNEDNIEKIAHVLNVSPFVFFGGEVTSKPASPLDAMQVLADHFGMELRSKNTNQAEDREQRLASLTIFIAKLSPEKRETYLYVIKKEYGIETEQRIRTDLGLTQ